MAGMTLDTSEMSDDDLARELAAAEKARRTASDYAGDARDDLVEAQDRTEVAGAREETAADLVRVIESEVARRRFASGFGDLGPLLTEHYDKGIKASEYAGRWYVRVPPGMFLLPDGAPRDEFAEEDVAAKIEQWTAAAIDVSIDGPLAVSGRGLDWSPFLVDVGDRRYQKRFMDLTAGLSDLSAKVVESSGLLLVWSGATLVLGVMPWGSTKKPPGIGPGEDG